MSEAVNSKQNNFQVSMSIDSGKFAQIIETQNSCIKKSNTRAPCNYGAVLCLCCGGGYMNLPYDKIL